MGLSPTVSEINGDFCRKLQIPPPLYLTPPMKGSPWNWVSALGVKKLDGATGLRKKFDDIFSHVGTIQEP